MPREAPIRQVAKFAHRDATTAERERVMQILQDEHDKCDNRSQEIQASLMHGHYSERVRVRREREMDKCLDIAEAIRRIQGRVAHGS